MTSRTASTSSETTPAPDPGGAPPGTGRRILLAALSAAVLAVGAGAYLLLADDGGTEQATASVRDDGQAPAGDPSGTTAVGSTGTIAQRPTVDGLDLDVPGGGLLFIDRTPGDHYGRLAFLPTDGSLARQQSDTDCERVYAQSGKILCLRSTGGAIPSYQAVLMDDTLREERVVELSGLPSRARLSADGAIGSWTVFVSGHSYLSVGFSTQTSILDLRTGSLIASLEEFAIVKDGEPYRSPDVNFWGVTVARDDRTFYATMATKGRTYLVKGDLEARTVTTIADNVECPSLSPDNTRIVFKKRVDADGGRKPWRLWVLDLATMTQTPLAEENSVDDQAAWLDDQTVAYSLPVDGIASYDLWSVPADGSGAPTRVLTGGASPSMFSATSSG